MAALTRQIVETSSVVPEAVLQNFRMYQTTSTSRLDFTGVQTMLVGEIKRYDKVYFVIDALDECPIQTRLDPLKRLSELQKLYGHVYIMFSSRDIETITEDIVGIFGEISQTKLSANVGDLKLIIRDQFSTRANLRGARRHSGLVEEFDRLLIQKAQGM